MNEFKRFTRKSAPKLLNLCLILSMVISILPLSVASAAPNAPFGVNADCTITQGASKILLPFISQGTVGQAASAAVAASGSTSTSTAPDARVLNYLAGKSYSYDWDLVVESKSTGRDSEGALEQTGEQTTVIRGVANVTVQAKDTDGVISGQITVDDPYVCSTDGETASVLEGEDYDTLAANLKKPLLFKQDTAGKVTEVSVPENSSDLAINMQKGIVNALQTTLKEENEYTAEEEGSQGTYTVSYKLSDETDGTHITKTYDQSSFSSLISKGDPASQLKQKNTIDMLLNTDGIYQSIKSVEEMQSSDESEDPPSTDGADFDGATAWSNTKSEGSLTLKGIADAPAELMAASLNSVYRIDSLGAGITDEIGNLPGIDLTQIDLAVEFAALEAAPTDPGRVLRIVDLVYADDSAEFVVLMAIQGRIVANNDNTEVVNAYIDVLTQVGTPKAQEIMSTLIPDSRMARAAGIAATLTITSQEHALINTVLLDSPTMTVVNTISDVVGTTGSALHDTAVTVLGTTAEHLDNPEVAGQITQQLIQSLGQASDDDTKTLYIDALGNTADPAALSTLSEYVQSTETISRSVDVQIAALTALRNMPGNEAEQLMVSALSSTNEQVDVDEDLFALRDVAFTLLANRDGLSDTAVAALDVHNTAVASLPSGYYTYNWNRHLGGRTVGVNLPGHMGIATPSRYRPYLYVRQAADAHIWSYKRNLIYGSLLAKSTSSRFIFKAYISIGGGLIRRSVNYSLPCSYNSGTRTLYSVNRTIFNVTIRVPIFWAITVNFNIRGSGYFRLTWNYRHNVCSLSSGSFVGTITPTVWARGQASAYLSIVIARGGGTLAADLLRTSIPARGTVSYANNRASFCLRITAVTQALNGRFYVWGDLRVPRFGIPPWKWKRIFTKTLWTFSTPTNNYTLYSRCV